MSLSAAARLLALVVLTACAGAPVCSVASGPTTSSSAAGGAAAARVLFDGRSTDGWTSVGEGGFQLLPDGTLATQSGRGVLYHTERFRDFVLDLDFLQEWPGATAGVLLRLPAAPGSVEAAEQAAYEIKLGEVPKPVPGEEPPAYNAAVHTTGAVNLVLPGGQVHHAEQMSPTRLVNRAVGEWNRLRVEAIGQRYRVWVNGELVNDFVGRRATEGHVALLRHGTPLAVRFRNVRVTPLAGARGPTGLADLVAVRTPKPPIRVLMITTTHGFRHTHGIHGSIEVMEELERTTELRVDTTENLSRLTPENLARYDVLFLANSTLRIAPADTTTAAHRAVRIGRNVQDPVTPAQQRAIADFVRSGKGLAVAHAGLDAFYGWNDFREMVGGGLFTSHPWTKHARVAVEDRDHPATRHLGDGFWIREEFYVLDRSPRATSRVLMSLDNASAGAPNAGRLPPPDRTDHPVSWMRTYGEGRVFATILGHFRDTWHRPDFVRHLLVGIRMAAGRPAE